MTLMPAPKELNALQSALTFAILKAPLTNMQSQPYYGENQITLSQYNDFALH